MIVEKDVDDDDRVKEAEVKHQILNVNTLGSTLTNFSYIFPLLYVQE